MNDHPIKALVGMLSQAAKPLPYAITADEYAAATPAQRLEWNARIAMGTDPEEFKPAPAPAIQQLPLLCTIAERDAATPEQVKDWEERLLQSWNDRRASELSDDATWDRRYGFTGA
jgi:hypothetical protein